MIKRNHRQTSIAVSDELLEAVRRYTKGMISLSAFARIAMVNELERHGQKITIKHGIYRPKQRRGYHED